MKKISAIVIATVLIVAIPLTCAGASTMIMAVQTYKKADFVPNVEVNA